ncbi:hypothetical protein TIFTF001_021890 [Ficus carica]|uniref:Uncharacterized protein n=1 Tax=Ficus carica TaxID=3494 RepID=A0AA88AIW7_FICCA|nr:hypothetical protein TIFTF001_021890 [Ficus carica]
MWSGSSVRTSQSLRCRLPAKGKHLEMTGTPVWCQLWELRSLILDIPPRAGCSEHNLARSRHQHKPPSISGLAWPGMLSVLVWSIAARTPFSLSRCSRRFGSGRVLREVYLFGGHASASAPCRLLRRVVPNSASAESCQGLSSKIASKTSTETIREGKIYFSNIFNMSDLSDSENDALSGSADITGSWSLTSSTSSSIGEVAAPRDRTPDHLSGISDIPFSSDPVTLISRGQEGAA